MTIAPAVSCVTSPVQEYEDGASTPSVEYIRGSDYGGGIGGILYTLRGSTPSFKHYNSRGDVVAATNASGSLTYQAAYEAFGQHGTTDSSGEWTDGATPLDRQQGNTKDEDPTGLLNEGFRYRDLETGTFITPDPLGFVDGPNVYTYVVQNPWTYFDPLGLMSHLIPNQYYQSAEFRQGFHESSKTMVPAAGVIAALPIAAKLGVAGVAKELASEGVDIAVESATGVPIPATSLTGLAKDGFKKLGKEAAEVTIEQTAKQTKEASEEMLYRGVPSGASEKAKLAEQGIAKPRGTATDPITLEKHVYGEDVASGATSWTDNRDIAKTFSGSDGTIIEVPKDKVKDKVLPRPEVKKYDHENETLLKGVIEGTPTTP